ncbi:MAG: hypothetical protein ABGW78_07410 [Pirellulales bacterium]
MDYVILGGWKVHPSRYQVSLAVTRPNLAKAKVVTHSGNRVRGCASTYGSPFVDEAFEGSMVDSENALPFHMTERTCYMVIGFPSLRIDSANQTHHLWNNNGVWWVHFTLHFDNRKRRVRRSLQTRSLSEAIERRDALLMKIEHEGECIPDRSSTTCDHCSWI